MLSARAATLGTVLSARGMRLGVAESCTGGWIAKVLTDIPGSSDWFDRGFVTYSNVAKIEMLGVDAAVLAELGAVSEAVAGEMAAGVRRLSACEAALAVSGIAGPGGGTTVKPVGLVCFGWIFFRAPDWATAWTTVRAMVGQAVGSGGFDPRWWLLILSFALGHGIASRFERSSFWERVRQPAFAVAYGGAVGLAILFVQVDVQPFLYFQF